MTTISPDELRACAGVRSDGDAKTMLDAADEIERLRTQVAEAKMWHAEVVNQWTNYFAPESDWSKMVGDALRNQGRVLENTKKEAE